MRLGLWECILAEGSRARAAYGQPSVRERHRHRYELNNDYRQVLADHGMLFSGTTADGSLVEIVELPEHPWFVAVQFHPEFRSRPVAPHPLFSAFIGAALEHQDGQRPAGDRQREAGRAG
jgi:CTP synthase